MAVQGDTNYLLWTCFICKKWSLVVRSRLKPRFMSELKLDSILSGWTKYDNRLSDHS